MNVKRILTAVIGLPIVILLLIFGNKYILDVVIAVVAIIALNEYFKAIKSEAKPIQWVGYLMSILIAFIHVINYKILMIIAILSVPTLLLILFLHIVITDMEINFKDIAFSFIGIVYILGFTCFVPLIYGLDTIEGVSINGKLLIWILVLATWGSDIFAYLIGKRFGKHKFSKVSPNKTIEGCTAGLISAVVLVLIYAFCLNYFAGCSLSYLNITLIAIILGIIGQIGDFAASTIKRYFDIKDFSNIFPGHGGLIDRLDSVIFTAPYAYILFLFVL